MRFKYACRHCDRNGINTPVVIAPMPPQPLPSSIATASTLAFALVHKYVDGTLCPNIVAVTIGTTLFLNAGSLFLTLCWYHEDRHAFSVYPHPSRPLNIM